MQERELIPVAAFCASHQIEMTFIDNLQHVGLLTMTTIQEEKYIYFEHLPALEKMVHLHYELDINIEGIETITHLLQRIEALQSEISGLRNRIDFYE